MVGFSWVRKTIFSVFTARYCSSTDGEPCIYLGCGMVMILLWFAFITTMAVIFLGHKTAQPRYYVSKRIVPGCGGSYIDSMPHCQ